MRIYEAKEALQEAELTLKACDNIATDMAYMLVGRLNKVNSIYVLRKLKKELENFNMKTGQWK